MRLIKLLVGVFTLLAMLTLAGCIKGTQAGGGNAGQAVGQTSVKTPTQSTDMAWSATLKYRKTPKRGKTRQDEGYVQEVLFTNQPLSEQYHGVVDTFDISLRYSDKDRGFTGSIKNMSAGHATASSDISELVIDITVSDGQNFTWKSADSALTGRTAQEISIAAPGL